MIRNATRKEVPKAVEHINRTIAPALRSKKLNVGKQEKTDRLKIKMDNTENASKFGSNVTLEVFLLSEKLGSWKQGVSAPSQL